MVKGLAVGLSQSYTASASVLAVASSFLRQSKDMHIDRGLETFHDLEVHSERVVCIIRQKPRPSVPEQQPGGSCVRQTNRI